MTIKLEPGQEEFIYTDPPNELVFESGDAQHLHVTAKAPATHDHDVTRWHPPTDHHHGYDPVHLGDLGSFFLEQTGQEVGYGWPSSPIENTNEGKHWGYTILHEDNLPVLLGGQDPNTNRIREYIYEVHTISTLQAMQHAREHSFAVALQIESPDGEQVGRVFTGGIADYGVFHRLYKRELCPLPFDPENYPYDAKEALLLPPYRALHRTLAQAKPGNNPESWNNQIGDNWADQWYPHHPNSIIRSSWAVVDAWQLPAGDCDAPEFVQIDGCFGSIFQVFELKFYPPTTERPFVGYTDRNGHIVPFAGEVGPDCIPLVIEEGVPQGPAMIDRAVAIGNPDNAPFQEFAGPDLTMPAYS